MMNEPVLPGAAQANPTAAHRPGPKKLDVSFTGSGSEYFRIWIVNLLLTLVTLTLYLPWARARRLRYFHGNTFVDGQPMGFHGDPKKMFRGYLLVAALLVAYSVAGKVSPTAGFIAFLILALVWPALMKSSLQFRLANTSWRGLRFQFKGSVRGAYEALLPAFVPSILILAMVAAINPEDPPAWFNWAMLAMLPVFLLVGPWLWWKVKKYQHDHYAFGGLQTRLDAPLGGFFGVFAKTVGITLLSMAGFAVLCAVLAVPLFVLGLLGAGGAQMLGIGGDGPGRPGLWFLLLLLIPVVAFLGLFSVYGVAIPYATSRMQNLVWSHTGNELVRFQSQLKFRSALTLTLKNWFLIAITLGLYWPFAAVSMARLRLQALHLRSQVDVDALVGQAQSRDVEAAGDAAGDLFGVDIGL
jgi:uncharacterized membrane protein YjgN (DUF898 family)